MYRALTYGTLALALFGASACSQGKRENQAGGLSEMTLIEIGQAIYDADCLRESGENGMPECRVDERVDRALSEADTRLFVWRATSFREADICQYLLRHSSCFQTLGLSASGTASCRSSSLGPSSADTRCGSWMTGAIAAGLSCNQLLSTAQVELNRINTCAADSDCVLWDPYVNCNRGLGYNRRADASRLKTLYRAYRGSCVDEPVMCTLELRIAERACVNNRCVSGVDQYGSF